MNPIDQRDVIDQVIGLLQQHYVFPDVAATLARTLTPTNATTVGEFADAVTDQLQAVNGDKHLRLIHHTDPLPANFGKDDEADLLAMRRWAQLSGGGIHRVQLLAGNVGYLDIRLLFPPAFAGTALVSAMALLADTDALLIDLRRCLGGDPTAVALLCGHLFDEPVELSGIYDRSSDRVHQSWTPAYVAGARFGGIKPVFVLTSGATFSGGEQVAYDLQELRRATVVGERTRGGAHPRRGFRVHEHLEVAIPVGRSVSPRSGDNWEGRGVSPDVAVPDSDAPKVAYRMALQRILDAGTANVHAEARAALTSDADPLTVP